jgi:dolichol-phosphate mannosyltransferase
VYYDRPERFAGETHYPLRKMIRFALDGIASFSTLPLRVAVWLGVAAGIVGLLVAVWAAYAKFVAHATLPGWTALMVAICLAASAQLLMIGVLGEYVGRIYEEVKRRPLYIVRDLVNVDVEPPARSQR